MASHPFPSPSSVPSPPSLPLPPLPSLPLEVGPSIQLEGLGNAEVDYWVSTVTNITKWRRTLRRRGLVFTSSILFDVCFVYVGGKINDCGERANVWHDAFDIACITACWSFIKGLLFISSFPRHGRTENTTPLIIYHCCYCYYYSNCHDNYDLNKAAGYRSIGYAATEQR